MGRGALPSIYLWFLGLQIAIFSRIEDKQRSIGIGSSANSFPCAERHPHALTLPTNTGRKAQPLSLAVPRQTLPRHAVYQEV